MTYKETITWHKIKRYGLNKLPEIPAITKKCIDLKNICVYTFSEMPLNNADILLQTERGVLVDTVINDGYSFGLKNHGNFGDVIAWAYLPKGINLEGE